MDNNTTNFRTRPVPKRWKKVRSPISQQPQSEQVQETAPPQEKPYREEISAASVSKPAQPEPKVEQPPKPAEQAAGQQAAPSKAFKRIAAQPKRYIKGRLIVTPIKPILSLGCMLIWLNKRLTINISFIRWMITLS